MLVWVNLFLVEVHNSIRMGVAYPLVYTCNFKEFSVLFLRLYPGGRHVDVLSNPLSLLGAVELGG